MEVAEALPLGDASVDAVVCTLVLCSVKDVDLTLRGMSVPVVFLVKSSDVSELSCFLLLQL